MREAVETEYKFSIFLTRLRGRITKRQAPANINLFVRYPGWEFTKLLTQILNIFLNFWP